MYYISSVVMERKIINSYVTQECCMMANSTHLYQITNSYMTQECCMMANSTHLYHDILSQYCLAHHNSYHSTVDLKH
jgi:hypothetical protein